MKYNKKRKINKRQYIEIFLNNFTRFIVDSEYIKEIVIKNKYVIKLKLSKKLFDEIKDYDYTPSLHNDSKVDFLDLKNISAIAINRKVYYAPIIRSEYTQCCSTNILQSRLEDDKYLTLKWDSSKKNKIKNVTLSDDWTECHLYLDKSYIDVKVNNYNRVIYY